MTRQGFVLVLCLTVGGCSVQGPEGDASPAAEVEQESSPVARVVENYTAAFNAHDVDQMRQLMADSIVWLSIVSDSVVVEARGADNLASGMIAYFEDFPDVASQVELGAEVGAFVHARESASWSQAGVRSSQASLSTYEIREGKVARVWYFPAG